ncbi:MAG: M23 family metallopeptidase, partial [Planctomycetota bacterium]|nr:M23 family metallopeptidase [Planctomycetota bacterium]
MPNLFNRTPTPEADGWSVRVTQVRDFRGRRLTYDSHNGTDFAIPPGTVVVASAPGRVASRRSEYNRGGLKLYVDHGDGLMSTYHHLGRTLVAVGADVARGQPIALSGYSGLDALVSFPWVAPHVHYNVLLGGVLGGGRSRGLEGRPGAQRAQEDQASHLRP